MSPLIINFVYRLDGFKVIECETWDEVSKEFQVFGIDPKKL